MYAYIITSMSAVDADPRERMKALLEASVKLTMDLNPPLMRATAGPTGPAACCLELYDQD